MMQGGGDVGVRSDERIVGAISDGRGVITGFGIVSGNCRDCGG